MERRTKACQEAWRGGHIPRVAEELVAQAGDEDRLCGERAEEARTAAATDQTRPLRCTAAACRVVFLCFSDCCAYRARCILLPNGFISIVCQVNSSVCGFDVHLEGFPVTVRGVDVLVAGATMILER